MNGRSTIAHIFCSRTFEKEKVGRVESGGDVRNFEVYMNLRFLFFLLPSFKMRDLFDG